jgi:hypothetical protein
MIDKKASPIFILSYERSGSTLLRYIIDTHPQICSPAELHLGRYCDDLAHIIDLLSIGKVSAEQEPGEKEQRLNAEVGRRVMELMNTYAQSKGKPMWCEKTPSNIDFIEMLHGVFPGAKYICLYRNCMDVVHSCVQKPRLGTHVAMKYYGQEPGSFVKNTKNKTAMFADNWALRTKAQLKFEREHPDQCFRVKYESLVADPGPIVRSMFEFLGVEWDEELLDAVFTSNHDPGPGDTKIMFLNRISTENIGAGACISREQIPQEILERVNEVLAELEYPVVGPDWNVSPPSYVPQEFRQDEFEAEYICDVREVFTDHFPRLLKDRSDRLRAFTDRYKFVVTGEGAGIWLIDLSKPGGQIRAEDSDASCTITISTRDLVAMVNGRLNPGLAFDQGKVNIEGDVRQAMGIGQLLLTA